MMPSAPRPLARALAALIAGGPGCTYTNYEFDDTEGSGGVITGSTTATTTATTGGSGTATTSGSTSSGSGSTSSTGSTSTSASTTTTTTGTTAGSTTTADCDSPIMAYDDLDMDGHGRPGSRTLACPDALPPGVVDNDDDCDDDNPKVYPGAMEVCDGIDNDCNDLMDEASVDNFACALFGDACDLAIYGGHFYYFCNKIAYPADIVPMCESLATGPGARAYVVQITSSEENGVILNAVSTMVTDAAIGLRDVVGDNALPNYRWVADESDLVGKYGGNPGMPPWGSGEPNDPAETWVIVVKSKLHWNDASHEKPYAFICEAETIP